MFNKNSTIALVALLEVALASNMTVVAYNGTDDGDGTCVGDVVGVLEGATGQDGPCINFTASAGCAQVTGYDGDLTDCTAYFSQQDNCVGAVALLGGGTEGATTDLNDTLSGQIIC